MRFYLLFYVVLHCLFDPQLQPHQHVETLVSSSLFLGDVDCHHRILLQLQRTVY
jgi:hypothetical protein